MTEEQEPSFEELLRQSEESRRTRVEMGEAIEGTVVLVTAETMHIDIGMRSEAVLYRTGDEREAEIKSGDTLKVFVVQPGMEVKVALDPVVGFGDMERISAAFQAGEPLEGKVIARNKGGFDVNIAGVRCFCPISQMAMARIEDGSEFVGKILPFKIQECQDKNVVVSHRALLEEERDRELEQVKAQIQPGARLTGQVVKMESFGAFIDFGARVQGLLHVSECAHQRVNHPQDLFQIGQELEVLVQSVELDARGRDRISLSRKALLPDPWNELNLEKDQVRKGVITRKVDFGWFVELAPGIEGLIPGRYLRSAGQKLEEAEFNEGQELEVVVVDFDSRQRQITLAIPGWDEKPASALKPGDTVKAKVVKIIPAGVLIQALEDPARGLIPKHTLQGATFKSLEKQFPIDGEIQAVLEAIDEQGRYNFRIRGDEEFVDDKTIQQYVSSDADMKHNPFAAFFKKD